MKIKRVGVVLAALLIGFAAYWWLSPTTRNAALSDTPQETLEMLKSAMKVQNESQILRLSTSSGFTDLQKTWISQEMPALVLTGLVVKNGLSRDKLREPWAIWQKWAQHTDLDRISWSDDHDRAKTADFAGLSLTFIQLDKGWKLDRCVYALAY